MTLTAALRQGVAMSAMEEYKRVCAIVRGKEYWAVDRSDVADAADAVIAELKAEVQHQIERREEEKLRAVNAEATLRDERKNIAEITVGAIESVRQAEAALAERDRMLAAIDIHDLNGEQSGGAPTVSEFLADLRARIQGKNP